ncbi:PREDICTED: uncharacterized protein LOC106748296 [Dinoponera quadriceps]|uniref:Uncharacterized protein LOC106748296 n=1 Tax=Dinoponera quadriceps TaxID=609295 RepID=A0A6P3XW91_DINQU|nr:PREDICTED: uncharacterized protein LOC106748296 [Dinoponera quadriceps]
MEFSGERYYKINKILLNGLGLWPHREGKRARIKPILIDATLFYAIFAQLCPLISTEYDVNLLLKVLSNILPALIFTINYNAYYILATKIQLLMELVRKDWNALDDKREIEIKDKHARIMHTCTIAFILAVCIGNPPFDFMEASPLILDWLVPLNESRPRHLYMLTEYFVDPERYFPLILIHEIITVLIGFFVIASTGAITLVYVEHFCAMMKIVSINLCLLLQLLNMKNLPDLLAMFVILIIEICYMFIANYMGQIIIDHSEDVHNTTCNILWYNAPLKSPKLLLFLMHRTIKQVKPVVGKLFVASLEGFATLSTTSLSYFTIIYSLQ